MNKTYLKAARLLSAHGIEIRIKRIDSEEFSFSSRFNRGRYPFPYFSKNIFELQYAEKNMKRNIFNENCVEKFKNESEALKAAVLDNVKFGLNFLDTSVKISFIEKLCKLLNFNNSSVEIMPPEFLVFLIKKSALESEYK